ncbi:hypothetical protein PI124_g2746 [Phytophthora idaei]|nr:hypothetical protein PI125_g15491 [Phytophthora idaei]KAG3168021.1 hypothetical protein PI126_g3505 [Phytophthora idaei]KAG3252704.1 hypothetical protein PI124_g2746 [Phytophthora idaei]
MTRSERAIALEWLEAALIVNALEGGTDGGDKETMQYKAISSNRYLDALFL